MNRLSAILKLLRQHSASHLLISDTIDVSYISGFTSSNALLLISAKKKYLFTDFRYEQIAKEFCSKYSQWNLVIISDSDFGFLKNYLSNGDSLAIQSNTLTIDQFDSLKKSCRGIKLIKINDSVSNVTSVKTDDEIKLMKRIAAIGDKAFSKFIKFIRPGMTEIEASYILNKFCMEEGSEKSSFDTIVLFGERTALPHGVPSSKTLLDGEFVLCDFGCVVDGFCSDMTRTFVMGNSSVLQKKIYNIVKKAQLEARKNVYAGITASDLDKIARDIISDAGYEKEFGHSLGHGVGRRVHEIPRVGRKNDTFLKENMVITIEPGIYISGFGGVRIEDMVVVKNNKKCIVLTKTPRKLIEIQY